MTDQQPHTPSSRHIRKDDYTPSLDQMRDLYVRHADQLGIASDHVLHAEFDRFLAAAEHRGAIKALREAAESLDIIDHMYKHFDKRPSQAPVAVRATAIYLHDRASQKEDDNE